MKAGKSGTQNTKILLINILLRARNFPDFHEAAKNRKLIVAEIIIQQIVSLKRFQNRES